MIIQDHEVHMESSRSLVERHEKNEYLNIWNGNNRIEIVNGERTTNNEEQQQSIGDTVNFSPEAMSRFNKMSQIPSSMSSVDSMEAEGNLPPKLMMMRLLLERFFGIKIDIVDHAEDAKGENPKNANSETAAAGQPAPGEAGQAAQPGQAEPEGWGIRYIYHEQNYEKESVRFAARGRVETEDGREIEFEAKLEMSKETMEEVLIDFRAGDALLDPLAINYDGKGVQLTEEKTELDLDMDGEKDNISTLQSGSGFLVLDKNQNGKVDDGSELFGPATNNGFLELANYDEDGNDWIDEKDAIFYDLKLWTKGEDGSDKLASIQNYDVGAIYLKNASTQFDLGEGELKDTGIYLKESGGVGFVQEVDLKVS
ncbi:MAG: hypothetical protein GY765_25330 [bacterium]|nr:hypothetical protein [bacterium]